LETERALKLKLWLKMAALVLGALLFVGWLIKTLYIMLAPFLLSVLISYLLHPTVNRLERKGLVRGWAILIVFSALLLVFGLFFFLLPPGIVRELQSLYTDFPAFIFSLEQGIRAWQSRWMPRYPLLARVDLVAQLATFRQAIRVHLLQVLPTLSKALTPYILFVPILTFFLLRDGPIFRKALFRLVPNRYFEMVFILQYRLSRQLRSYLRGILLDSLFVGTVTTLGLHLANIRYALFFGLTYGLANLVPFFGPILGTLPGILLAASQGSTVEAVFPALLVYGLAQFISITLIIPLLMSRMVQLHPVVVIMAVIAGANLFGPIGPLIAVPLTCILKVILWESYYGIKSFKHGSH